MSVGDTPALLWRPSEHSPLASVAWSADRVTDAIAGIIADAERTLSGCFWPPHPLDQEEDEHRGPWLTFYLGTAGVVWALDRLGTDVDLGAVMTEALGRVEPEFGEYSHDASFWMGETGLQMVAAKVGSRAYDEARLRELISANRDHPTRELMWGSPGTILAARWFHFDDLAAASCAALERAWDEESGLWTQDLYGKTRQFVGPPHGFAGNVHALRGHLDDTELRSRATETLERLALRADGLVNWPPVAGLPAGELAEQVRVQWCHGAPGIVTTLGNLIPIELAEHAGELTWRAGPLEKGTGLCHGTAGNGYALLKLFSLTGDELWLDRARQFAMHAIEQIAQERARFGQGRYSLWLGEIGAALYLRACMDADSAFPTIDYW